MINSPYEKRVELVDEDGQITTVIRPDTIKVKTEATHYKAVFSGHIIETYEFQNPIFLRGNDSGGRKNKTEKKSERKEENRNLTLKRAKEKIRRLALCNFNVEYDKFITLTYAENFKDIKESNKNFKKFIQKLRYRYNDFKYVAVIEFQKRGAIHYHILSNLPYIKNKELRELWNHGNVKINAIKHVDNIGAYITKYMIKDSDDKRLEGEKSYLTSKNLIKPTTMYSNDAQEAIRDLNDYGLEPVREGAYYNDFTGQVVYKQYNPYRKEEK